MSRNPFRREVLHLWRHILRSTKKLDERVQSYYKEHARSNFNQHKQEDDPERIKEIIDASNYQVEWILRKYLPEDQINAKKRASE